jgi:hypothetical protein
MRIKTRLHREGAAGTKKPGPRGPGRRIFVCPVYFRSFFAVFSTSFALPPLLLLFLLPVPLPLTAFLTCFSIPAMRLIHAPFAAYP